MLQLYIGDGKGKTTAILGLALRALGWDRRIYIGQFLKDRKSPCGEIRAIKENKLKIKIERFKDQVHPIFLKGKKIDKEIIKKSVKKSLSKIEKYIKHKSFDIIILDEILNVYRSGFLSRAELERFIKKSKGLELICTGREAPGWLVDLADYVSFIKKVKHPFDKKIFARKGIEF